MLKARENTSDQIVIGFLVSYLNEGDFQLSVERHLDCIGLCVTSLYFYSVIGPDYLAPFSQPIRFTIKTNRGLVTLVFPRFKQLNCLYFAFSLAFLYVSSQWLAFSIILVMVLRT